MIKVLLEPVAVMSPLWGSMPGLALFKVDQIKPLFGWFFFVPTYD